MADEKVSDFAGVIAFLSAAVAVVAGLLGDGLGLRWQFTVALGITTFLVSFFYFAEWCKRDLKRAERSREEQSNGSR